MKRIITVAIWVFVLLVITVLTGFINYNLKDEKCKQVIVNIIDANKYGFIEEGDVIDLLNAEFNTPISQKIRDIDTYKIEKRLQNHMAVANANVYISIDGRLVIELNQRKPILRVFGDKHSFYIDSRGKIMPLSPKFTAHVPIATGNVNFDYYKLLDITNQPEDDIDSTHIPSPYFDLYKLATYLDRHPFWSAQIEQLYVDKESELELIPRVGNHTIVLGEVYNLDSKFNKLMLFYKEGLSKTGWNEYKTINLKFKNQVVCTKRY